MRLEYEPPFQIFCLKTIEVELYCKYLGCHSWFIAKSLKSMFMGKRLNSEKTSQHNGQHLALLILDVISSVGLCLAV